jgi:hypothetical protein
MGGRSPHLTTHYIAEAVFKGIEGMKASGETNSFDIKFLPQNEKDNMHTINRVSMQHKFCTFLSCPFIFSYKVKSGDVQ